MVEINKTESIVMDKNDVDLIKLVNCSENLTKEDDIKVVVVLKPAGNAPILASNKIKISGSFKVYNLLEYLRKCLKNSLSENDNLFLYCNSNFSPTLTTQVIDLYNNFAINNELMVYYAITEAWG